VAAEVPASRPTAAARGTSRNTTGNMPPPSPEAVEVFGAALEKAQLFGGLLATDGVTRGLIGPRETSRLWDRHLVNCAVVAELLPDRGELVDIGSGAGLPGMATARAVAPLDRLVGWAAGLLRPGGQILAIKGQAAEEELAAARPVLSRLGVRSAEVLRAGQGRVISATTVVRVVMGGHGREEHAGAHRSRRGVAR